MATYYILDGHNVVPTDNVDAWGAMLDDYESRKVARETIGQSDISTCFFGNDANFGQGPLHVFETMVFGGPLSDECVRYSTWEEAEAGHKVMVERVKAANPS